MALEPCVRRMGTDGVRYLIRYGEAGAVLGPMLRNQPSRVIEQIRGEVQHVLGGDRGVAGGRQPGSRAQQRGQLRQCLR
jgi:hypothetical protein